VKEYKEEEGHWKEQIQEQEIPSYYEIWEVDSVEAGEIEAAHAALLLRSPSPR